MLKKHTKLSSKKPQKGASTFLILILVLVIITLIFLYLKARGIINMPVTLSNAATSINQTLNPFTPDYSGYGVQISASKNLDDAKKVMNEFAKEGYSAFVVSSIINGKTMYQVRLGPYDIKENAENTKDQIKRRYPRNPYTKHSFIIYRDQ